MGTAAGRLTRDHRRMHAITINEPGGPEVLAWTEVPDPAAPGPGEVLVRVAASAVNRADLLQRQGRYSPPPGASPYLGLECSGGSQSLGPGVEGWSVGDEVCALLSGGGYAEQVLVPAGQLLPVPAGVSLVEAAALPEAACTVWSNVFMGAGLRPGEMLLVHGGGSGIGTMAIQLARQLGARVAVTAGSAATLERCSALGAEICVNYREQDFEAVVREATGGRGADVILDNMGAKYLARNVSTLAVNGRLVVIGLQGGVKAELDLGLLLAKRAAVLGDHAARPPGRGEGRHRRARSASTSGRRSRIRRGAPGHRPHAADARGGRGPPGARGRRPRRQGAAGRPRSGLTRDALGPVGEGRGLQPAGHPELGQDVRDVHAGGLLRDEQRLGDLAVAAPVGEQAEHLVLARGERRQGPGIGPSGADGPAAGSGSAPRGDGTPGSGPDGERDASPARPPRRSRPSAQAASRCAPSDSAACRARSTSGAASPT